MQALGVKKPRDHVCDEITLASLEDGGPAEFGAEKKERQLTETPECI